nr:Uncharacterised protein [Raoultella sp. NCTC 9187]
MSILPSSVEIIRPGGAEKAPGPAAGAEQALLDNTNVRVFYPSGEAPVSGKIGAAVLQRFLTFLAERGVSCSDRRD